MAINAFGTVKQCGSCGTLRKLRWMPPWDREGARLID